ncbi:hypothetical protein [Rhodococcus gannanensis]|uniref:Uncharacterized protein n=1 Tax=Rhodococcus gannanensis TaxID=1960308 RepID=A0ABW4P573_9NOCA
MTQIPDPLPPPPTDAGQGEWGSQPLYSRADDLLWANAAAKASLAADAAGWTNASAHLDHYLDNSGEVLHINADTILRDVPDAAIRVNAIAESELRRVAAESLASQHFDVPVQFQSQWHEFYVTESMDSNWYFAMGGMEFSSTGVVVVHRPGEGAEPSIAAEYKFHVFDRYNWDGEKSVDIAGVTITDARMGALHTAGLAREYDIVGSSEIRRYEGVVPVEGSLNLPGTPGGRDGDRTDPTR